MLDRNSSLQRATLLNYPYPYRTAIAFANDIDSASFQSVARVHGCFYGLEPGYEGVGLEFANSFWFMGDATANVKAGDFYLLNYDGSERPGITGKLREFVAGPMFDTLHTYGNFRANTFDRSKAEKCVEFSNRFGIHPAIWTYHGNKHQYQNIDVKGENWVGDDPESRCYHLDLLMTVGVKHFRVWPSLDLLDPGIRPSELLVRDGQTINCFQGHAFRNDILTSDVQSYMGGLRDKNITELIEKRYLKSKCHQKFARILTWSPEFLKYQIDADVLESAIKNEKSLIINQHLTRSHCQGAFYLTETKDLLRRLSSLQEEGAVLVCGLARLVNFEYYRDNLNYTVFSIGSNGLVINIDPYIGSDATRTPTSTTALEGIGFYVETPNVHVQLNGKKLHNFEVIKIDEGSYLIHYPWKNLASVQRDCLSDYCKAFKYDLSIKKDRDFYN